MNAREMIQAVVNKQIANGSPVIVEIPTARCVADRAIILARKHVGNGAAMESSARFCLADAIVQLDAGNLDAAHMWAKKSLSYSVGIFHADYKRA